MIAQAYSNSNADHGWALAMNNNPRGIGFRIIGYGVIHIVLCIMYFWGQESSEGSRFFPLLLPLIIFGPLAFALEIYWRFLREK
jgi:hypothetical protein